MGRKLIVPWTIFEPKWMDILLQRLVETPTNDIEFIIENRSTKIALLHMWYGREMFPFPFSRETVGNFIGYSADSESTNFQHSHFHTPGVE